MKKIFLPVLIFFFANNCMIAQVLHHPQGFCGTPEFRMRTIHHIAANKSPTESFTTLYIPVTANLVGNDNGTGYYSVEKTMEALCKLNTDFEEYGFLFYLENFNYINSSAFNVMHPDTFLFQDPMFQFIKDHNTLNTMNIYIVQQAGGWSFVSWEDWADWDYTIYPPPIIHTQGHGIVLDKGYLNDLDHLFTHEVGHFLGLYHTFNWVEDWNIFSVTGTPDTAYYDVYDPGTDSTYTFHWLVSRVDGVNCDISGDLICDTPPDYLPGFQCNANQESNILQTDPVGATFRSDGTYYMSYANDACTNRFSAQQVDVMHGVAEGPRSYLLYNQTVPQELSLDDLAMIYPPDGETVAVESDSITLEWDMPGADFYLLTYGRKANNIFLPIKSNIFLTENEYQLKVNYPDKDHYWIVRGVSKYFPCEVWADTSYFVPQDFVSTREAKPSPFMSLHPNPVSDRLYLHFSQPLPSNQPLEVSVFDMHGRVVMRSSISDGQMIEVGDLATGVYTLKVVAEEQVFVGRFVKQ